MEYETLSKEALVSRLKRLEAEKESDWDNIKNLIVKISHEMKTPLNSIIGFSELFRMKTDDENLIRYTDNIKTASNLLLSLVQNFIDISTAQNERFEPTYSIFNPKDTIEEIVKNFPKAEIKTTLIDKNICADYTRFRQLVYNLISNAIKYGTSAKPIIIMTYLEDSSFCFDITDFGEGIEKDEQDRIFELFTQVTKDKTKRQIGSGIGLALCKAIVEAHRGEISVESEIGKGSTFSFKLPVDKV